MDLITNMINQATDSPEKRTKLTDGGCFGWTARPRVSVTEVGRLSRAASVPATPGQIIDRGIGPCCPRPSPSQAGNV